MSSANAQADDARIEAIVRSYLSKNPELVESIVKQYLRKNPEIVQEALGELIKRKMPAAAKVPTQAERAAAIKTHATALFQSSRQVSVRGRLKRRRWL